MSAPEKPARGAVSLLLSYDPFVLGWKRDARTEVMIILPALPARCSLKHGPSSQPSWRGCCCVDAQHRHAACMQHEVSSCDKNLSRGWVLQVHRCRNRKVINRTYHLLCTRQAKAGVQKCRTSFNAPKKKQHGTPFARRIWHRSRTRPFEPRTCKPKGTCHKRKNKSEANSNPGPDVICNTKLPSASSSTRSIESTARATRALPCRSLTAGNYSKQMYNDDFLRNLSTKFEASWSFLSFICLSQGVLPQVGGKECSFFLTVSHTRDHSRVACLPPLAARIGEHHPSCQGRAIPQHTKNASGWGRRLSTKAKQSLRAPSAEASTTALPLLVPPFPSAYIHRDRPALMTPCR